MNDKIFGIVTASSTAIVIIILAILLIHFIIVAYEFLKAINQSYENTQIRNSWSKRWLGKKLLYLLIILMISGGLL